MPSMIIKKLNPKPLLVEMCHLPLISVVCLFQRSAPEKQVPFDVLLPAMILQGDSVKKSTQQVKSAFGSPSLPSALGLAQGALQHRQALLGSLPWCKPTPEETTGSEIPNIPALQQWSRSNTVPLSLFKYGKSHQMWKQSAPIGTLNNVLWLD